MTGKPSEHREDDGLQAFSHRGSTEAGHRTVSRREFLSGALGAGAVLATGTLVLTAGCSSKKEDDLEAVVAKNAQDADIATLKVSVDQLVESADFEEAPVSDYLVLESSWDLPKGSLVYVCSKQSALVLVPGASTEALIKLAFLNLSNGELTVAMEHALKHDEDYVIYDARASDTALIWVECNMQTAHWQVYCSTLANGILGDPQLIDEGQIEYEPPLLCVSDDKVYWTYMPDPLGPANQEDSFLKATKVRDIDPQVVYTSHGRMITNPLASEGIITLVPRVDTDNVYYQLTALKVDDDSIVAVSILPQAMKVNEAIYMSDAFTFCTENNYDYAEGLAYFGTYRDLGDGTYLHVNKMPTSAAALFNENLILRSTKNAVGIDIANRRFFVIELIPNSADYGDILAAWGVQDKVVIYSTVAASGSSTMGTTRLRVFGEQVDNSQTNSAE